MKQKVKITIILIIFSLIMIYVFSYFNKKYSEVDYINVGKAILSQSYGMKEGTYNFNDGVISMGKTLYENDKFDISGEGVIDKDKYGNIKFYINSNGHCIYKNSLDNVKYMDSECQRFENLVVDIIKNNNNVSFSSLDDNLSYKISDKDDFIGEWISEDYTGNITLNKYSQGKNYIWFKNKNGVISDVIEFNIDCLNSNGANYNKEVFYCSGAIVKIDSLDWIVVSDNSSEITLMKKTALSDKMSHCTAFKSNSCYYIDENDYVSYKWSNSYVNMYLNDYFINELSASTKYNLQATEICDEFDNMSCNEESCGGLKKEEINKYGYTCDNYTYSLVRLLSYKEYNKLFVALNENSLIRGNYLLINSFSNNKASIVDSNYEVFIEEDILSLNKIRPVITLKK